MSTRLVVDVGNTNIAFGLFNEGELHFVEHKLTSEVSATSDLEIFLSSYMKISKMVCKEAVISCGVARIQKILEGCKTFKDIDVSYLSGTNARGAILEYETPETLGPDRIANTIAAVQIYGSPTLVIDCGTAINIDFINRDGAFEGGLIAPGIVVSRDALATYAPALPEVEILKPKNFIGRTTVECIQSGLINGAISLIENVINSLRADNNELNIVLTGGHGTLIHRHLEVNSILDEDLTLKGLGMST